MINEQVKLLNPNESVNKCYHKSLSWRAILIGALIGVGLGFLLNLFSISIGLSLITTSKDGIMTIALGGFFGMAIGTIAIMFVTGYVAGYLGRLYYPNANLGVLYGFATWCLALVLMVLLAASMSRYLTFYSNAVSHPSMVVTSNKGVYIDDAKTSNPVLLSDTTVKKSITDLGIGSFLIFILFLCGALASCFGGHCGMVGKSTYNT